MKLDSELAMLHKQSIGIGPIMDSENSCRSRIQNTISPPVKNNLAEAESLLKVNLHVTRSAAYAPNQVYISSIPCHLLILQNTPN